MTTLPSTRLSSSTVSLNAPFQCVQDQPVCLEDVFELAGVFPPTLDDVRPHGEAAVDQVLDRIRDLELVPEARRDLVHRVEDLRAEHVHADQRQVPYRLLRLFDQTHHVAIAELRDAEHLRVGYARKQDLRRGLLARELIDEMRDAFVEQIVAEVHHERIRSDERLADLDGMGEAARRVLFDVLDTNAPFRSVADGRSDFRLRLADHDPDVAYPAPAMASIP